MWVLFELVIPDSHIYSMALLKRSFKWILCFLAVDKNKLSKCLFLYLKINNNVYINLLHIEYITVFSSLKRPRRRHPMLFSKLRRCEEAESDLHLNWQTAPPRALCQAGKVHTLCSVPGWHMAPPCALCQAGRPHLPVLLWQTSRQDAPACALCWTDRLHLLVPCARSEGAQSCS